MNTDVQKPNLVLIHGWGADNNVWQTWAEQTLGASMALHFIELPGFGQQPEIDLALTASVEKVNQAWLASLVERLPNEPTWVLGWSLGGLMAQQLLLRHPERVLGIINLASTPCFQQGQGWRYGVAPSLMLGFIQALQEDGKALLNTFYALQCQGGDKARLFTRQLRQQYLGRALPSFKGLYQGLQLLQSLDLRGKMRHNKRPCLWLLGEKDPLVPAAGLLDWVTREQAGSARIINGAAHIPFLSHPDLTSQSIIEFIHTENRVD
ncbi:alpha/beta fold hydrolase [Thiomicrospira sp. ALE5]|uniref:alpha/beta fold hydrolase n=1 Tax=Thiomicrospira sp. ALE5 TaxID=748650 RepID=UPI0008E023C5|nr:alpha/beta fold hydrolase [Thiomicrospira sp. ALE5]SFR55818.1 pimeloyl-[acyl-carrier protein] methyl ester esterase [Thiomicrospira sp. ALE5]